MLTREEILDKFPTKEALKNELKRIKPIKEKYHNLASWGNVEAKESWRNFCKYEKDIKEVLKM